MKHFPAVLLGALVIGLVAAGLACGGDDKQPQIGNGPADIVAGIWQGTYMAADGSQSGAFCVNFEQDDRGLTGKVAFNSGALTDIGGVITDNKLLFTWGAGLQTGTDPATSTDITAGGTMNGTSSNGALSGTWIAAASVDIHGDWTAKRVELAACG